MWSDVTSVGLPPSSAKISVKLSFLSFLTQTSYALHTYLYRKNWKQYHIQWKHKSESKKNIRTKFLYDLFDVAIPAQFYKVSTNFYIIQLNLSNAWYQHNLYICINRTNKNTFVSIVNQV